MAFDNGVSMQDLEAGDGKKLPPAIYTFDFETDPFKAWVNPWEQRVPKPFAVGVYCINTGVYEYHWGTADEVVGFLLDCMDASPAGSYWFAHNGGKFDFHFFLNELEGTIKIIGARIAQGRVGRVVIRDSFAMLPVPLKKFVGKDGRKKKDIEMWKLEPEHREKHRVEILAYMKEDCLVLGDAIREFIREFGMHLTMAGAAMKELQKRHDFDRMASKVTDERFRKFYYGGRVECMESGILSGDFELYDVNSMYPAVMRNFEHPVSADFTTYKGPYAEAILPRCDFAEVEAINYRCLPSVTDDGKLTFRRERGTFFATGHEIRAGIETGTVRILKVKRAYKGERHTTFATFVDHFFKARREAKAKGDDLRDLFYKLVMNSSYGKFAQNPAKYKDWQITQEIFDTVDSEGQPTGYVLEHTFPAARDGEAPWHIWSSPSETPEHLMRFNVATAASVTGAARSVLWRGICASKRPIYCDTDSLMCEAFNGDIGDELGQWKFETAAKKIAIAGRKLYAMFDGDGAPVKQASKGVRVSAKAIEDVARGETIVARNDAPTFSLGHDPRFIERRIRKTV